MPAGTIVSTGILEGKDYHREIPGKGDGMVKVCPGWGGIIAVLDDGSVRYIQNLSNMQGIEDWMGIIDAAIGTDHAVGLLFDGTVVTAGRNSAGQNDVRNWTHIAASAGENQKALETIGQWRDIGPVS